MNPKRRPYRVPTPENLTNLALFYLSRFAASEASLRRVLDNRIRRAAQANPEFAAAHDAQAALRDVIERIITTHRNSGVLNDAAFAEMKVNSLRRAGRSARAIEQKLRLKGIAPTLIAKALSPEDAEQTPAEREIEAVRRLARKKNLTPEKLAALTPEKKRKLMASFARAGFGFDSLKVLFDDLPDFNED